MPVLTLCPKGHKGITTAGYENSVPYSRLLLYFAHFAKGRVSTLLEAYLPYEITIFTFCNYSSQSSSRHKYAYLRTKKVQESRKPE